MPTVDELSPPEVSIDTDAQLLRSPAVLAAVGDALGTTPAAWLNKQRLMRAQHLLEETSLGLEAIASETGFGSAAVMRHHFVKTLQTTPANYRRTFCVRELVS
jgi:AraC-like DNA-binding protein